MPDRSDVEQALAGLIAGVLYPEGPGAAPALGVACRVYRGWPVTAALEADLARGVVHVTVQPVAGAVRETTRYPQEWAGEVPAATVLASVQGETVTFGGSAGAGQVAGILVDGRAYAYRVREGDTVADVAGQLAAQIATHRAVVLDDQAMLLGGGRGLLARVVADGRGAQELRRQRSQFRVTLWCPDPATRDQVAAAIDLMLAGAVFLDVGGWACRVGLGSDSSRDEGSTGGVWRRDLVYWVEYPTVLVSSLPAMLFGVADANGASAAV